jgi:hypothetical protein
MVLECINMFTYDVDDPRRYEEAPESLKATLQKGIVMTVKEAKTADEHHDLYVLKHRFEDNAFGIQMVFSREQCWRRVMSR